MTQTPQKKRPLYIRYAGPMLLETPLLNKGSAFSVKEKQAFNLEGLLPFAIETIEEQETTGLSTIFSIRTRFRQTYLSEKYSRYQ